MQIDCHRLQNHANSIHGIASPSCAANGNVQNLDLCTPEVARRGHNQDTDLELPMGYSLAVCPSEDCHNGQTGGSFQSGGIFVCLVSRHTLL